MCIRISDYYHNIHHCKFIYDTEYSILLFYFHVHFNYLILSIQDNQGLCILKLLINRIDRQHVRTDTPGKKQRRRYVSIPSVNSNLSPIVICTNPLLPEELIDNIYDTESKPEEEETTKEDDKTFDSTIISNILPANSIMINNDNIDNNVDQISKLEIILVECNIF